MVHITVDGQLTNVKSGSTILQAAENLGIHIPTFCHDKRLAPQGACRICVVQVHGTNKLMTACTTPVYDGMVVETHNENIIQIRKEILELLIEDHPLDCLTCEKSGECKLQKYCYEYDVKEGPFKSERKIRHIDDSNHFFINDQNKCIKCGKCVQVCNELQCTGAIGQYGRGFDTYVGAPFEIGLGNSACVSCGNCVAVCPVGALYPKKDYKFRYWEVKKVRTTCSYCGVGCQMDLLIKGNRVVEVQPADGPSNQGLLCVKGRFGYHFISHSDRLKTPLIKKDGVFVEATWDEAYDLIVSKINETKEIHGPDAIGGFSSAKCTSEENYLMQKLFRAVIGTNNIDHCARLCHASTVAGLAITFGSGAMTNSITEVLDADTILVTGSNTTENHPVIGTQIKRAKKKGAKLIVADPRKIELAKYADVFLQIKPGTNIALFNSIMHVIIKEGWEDKEYIRSRTEGYEELVKSVEEYTPEKAGKICGVAPEDIVKAARIYSRGQKAGIFYAMGITQHSSGTEHVMSISNLAMLCGNVGIESAGVNPLRGQNNVQGACDMGAIPNAFPGYQSVSDPGNIEKFEKAWGVKLSERPGLTIPNMLNGAREGKVKLLYIMGENPMVSDPDITNVKEALNNLDFLVVQDIFMTETAELADVVLPVACFAEKDGTFTNTERRIQRVRKAVEGPGISKADWEVLTELMNRLGYSSNYKHPSEIMDEIANLTPQYGGVDFDRIEGDGLQWPCPTKEHPGTKYLHKDKFTRGRGLFKPVAYTGPAELPNEQYSLILTTGRHLYHYHTRTMTGRVAGLNKIAPESYIEISPELAYELNIHDKEKIIVSSRRGSITTRAKITDIVEGNVVFMPFHYAQGAANILTNAALDPICNIPEYKVCAVQIKKYK